MRKKTFIKVRLLAAEITNEFICHLPYSILQLAAFYHSFGLKPFDEYTLYAMDAILKDKNFRKYLYQGQNLK